jgi:hypothetical protein
MLAQSGTFSNQKPWVLRHWLCRNLRRIFTGTSHPFPVFLFTNSNPLVAQIVFHIHFIAQ